jgi:hypothetical protein
MAKIARLRTVLREAKEDIENNDEAGAYLIIKSTLNPSIGRKHEQRSTALTRQSSEASSQYPAAPTGA